MRKDVRPNWKQHLLMQSAAGLALGVPLALSAADPQLPVIQPTAATTAAAPVSTQAPAEKPQFQPQQYQSEVQRQLNLLYEQNAQPGVPQQGATLPPPPPGGSPPARKMKMKDMLSPSAWKRQYHRWQRGRKQDDRRHHAAAQTPEAHLGAPADVTLGGVAPTVVPEVAASVPIPPTMPAAAESPASSPAAAVPTQPAFAPTPAAPRPQLQRVSPEIFADPSGGPAPLAQPPVTASTAPDLGWQETPVEPSSEQQPGLLPTPASSDPSPIETPVAETPLLILVPNPEQSAESRLSSVQAAPPAEALPPADPSQESTSARTDGFIDESSDSTATTAGSSEDDTLLVTDTAAPAPELTVAEPLGEQSASPFTGLELEANPFTDPAAAAEETEPRELPVTSQSAQATLPAKVPGEPAPLTAPTWAIPAPQPVTAAPVSIAPATMSPPAQLAAPTNLEAGATSPQFPVASVPASAAPVTTASAGPRPDVQKKLTRIAERKGLTGFKGFCPVMLKDHRELVDAKLEHTLIYEGRQYWFSSAAARETFLLDPVAYVPARDGLDVVIFDRTGESREGSLDHAVWYRGRLYLFDSDETRFAFAREPQAHQVTE